MVCEAYPGSLSTNVDGCCSVGLESLSSEQAANSPTLHISSNVDFNIFFIVVYFFTFLLFYLFPSLSLRSQDSGSDWDWHSDLCWE